MLRREGAALIPKRTWLAALAILVLPLLAGVNARLAVSRQLFEEEARLQREIEAEQARSEFLVEYEQHARSEEFVERWARGARMIKPGEVAVVPQMPVDILMSAPLPVQSHTARDYAVEWWAAFFAGVP